MLNGIDTQDPFLRNAEPLKSRKAQASFEAVEITQFSTAQSAWMCFRVSIFS